MRIYLNLLSTFWGEDQILTTGTFTAESKKEARRDGAPPIELVDGDKLVEMFQTLELGVVPKTVYEIDDLFFDDFRNVT